MQHLARVSRFIDALSDQIGRWVGWGTLAMVIIGSFNALARAIGSRTG